jgi:hypothetical protein
MNADCKSGQCVTQGAGGGYPGSWCSIQCTAGTNPDPKCQTDTTNFTGKCGGNGLCQVKAP